MFISVFKYKHLVFTYISPNIFHIFISATPTCVYYGVNIVLILRIWRSELLQCFVAVVDNIVVRILSPVYYAS